MKVDRTQSVYVIYNPDVKRTKIGISEDVDKRMASLRSSSGCDLKLVFKTVRLLGADYYESIAHDHFKEHRHIGEWFNIDPSEVVPYVEEITKDAKEDSIIKYYKEGVKISDICEAFDLSRSGVIKHLKTSGEYDTKKSVIQKTEVKKPDLFKIGNTVEYSVRVESNIYRSRSYDNFCFRIYSDGCFKERFFDTLEQAQRFKKNCFK